MSKETKDFPQATWDAYVAAERDQIRSEQLRLLDEFIALLLRCSESDWMLWAINFAQKVESEETPVPVRYPLFVQVVFPALYEGLCKKTPGCAHLLAHFASTLRNAPECLSKLPETAQTAHGLYELALQHDPTDIVARRKLIECLAQYLDYTLHELPSGVLYGHNGASAAECVELQATLQDFEEHVSIVFAGAPDVGMYDELIAECRFHYPKYEAYRRLGHPGGSYASYLASLGEPFE